MALPPGIELLHYEVKIMKWSKSALLLMALCGTVASAPAWAQHRGHGRGRAHVGVVIGAPLFWPPYYYGQPHYYPYYPYAYPYQYPTVVAVPSEPPVYIEQSPQQQQQYWYFCNNPQGYYPYVKQCPSGWQQVAPTPPGK